MTHSVEQLLVNFNANPPAGEGLVQLVEKEAGLRLPDDYSQFLQIANGGEGFLGEAYLILWRVEELMELNKAYQVAEYAPGLFLFGSSGGGEAFAFDCRTTAMPIVSVPFVGMELSATIDMASTFTLFLGALSGS